MNWKMKLARAGLQLKKHSPTILTWVGVVSIPVSIVLACKATLKLDETLDEVQDDISQIKHKRERQTEENYPEKTYKKELALSYVNGGLKLGKLYGPSALLASAAMGSILGSHHIMAKRNFGLLMTYQAVKASFDQYRLRVAELYGDEQEARINYDIQEEKIDVEYEDAKGKKKTKKETVDKINFDSIQQNSPYSRFFDELNPNWERSSEYNLMFLNMVQNWANDKLRARGHLFLNEVYEALGFPHSEAGAIVGWVYNPKDESHVGDNYIDFRIYDISLERSHAFVNGYEKSILLDFNVDGVIYNLI